MRKPIAIIEFNGRPWLLAYGENTDCYVWERLPDIPQDEAKQARLELTKKELDALEIMARPYTKESHFGLAYTKILAFLDAQKGA